MANNSYTPLIIRILDVGHGDSIIIEFPGGKRVGIIDCNTHQESNRGYGVNWDKFEPKVLTYLRKRLENGESFIIDFICLTHFHDDHFTGLGKLTKELVNNGITINEFWDTGYSAKKISVFEKLYWHRNQRKEQEELIKLYEEISNCRKKGTIYRPLVTPQEDIKNIEGVNIDILSPDSILWEKYLRYLAKPPLRSRSKKYITDEHLLCSCLMLRYGGAKIILGADLKSEAWVKLVKYWETKEENVLKSNVIKVSHHGSKEGNFFPPRLSFDKSLWQYLSSDKTVAIISGGYRNKLPHQNTLKELSEKKVHTYCTGNFTKFQNYDTIQNVKIPLSARQHIQEFSKPVPIQTEPYHGDVIVKVYNNGEISVESEYSLPPL